MGSVLLNVTKNFSFRARFCVRDALTFENGCDIL